MNTLAMVALVVDDYDHALEYYVGVLGFTLLEDTVLSRDQRWVVVAPDEGVAGARILLARARGEEQLAAVGSAAGGRVAFFLHCDNFDATYERFLAAGVNFTELPRDEPWGRVVVFRDQYGNGWDLIEASERVSR
jgi:catechol 2,3-dioxygenase-like lactoylglutathione lyase family enzyme